MLSGANTFEISDFQEVEIEICSDIQENET